MTVAARPIEYAAPPAGRPWHWPYWLLTIAVIGLFFMILVPQMCRPREGANQIKSQSNLRQIGLALKLYAGENGDALPDGLATLLRHSDLTPDVLVSPLDDREKATGATPDAWADRIAAEPAKFCSYRYTAAGLRLADLDADAVLAFEPAADRAVSRINLLMADGHVDDRWVAGPEGRAAYDRFLADADAGRTPLRWAADATNGTAAPMPKPTRSGRVTSVTLSSLPDDSKQGH